MIKLLTKNLHIKILALLSAIILWFFVVGIENAVSLFPQEIEVKPQNLSENLYLASPLPKVKISIRASQDILKTVTPNDFEIVADLKDLEAGTHKIPLRAKSFTDNASILKIEPATVQVSIEPILEKTIKVKTQSSGKPAGEYIMKGSKPVPDQVTIKGPKQFLDTIKEVVALIKFDGTQTEDYTQNINISLPEGVSEEITKNITMQPSSVEIKVDLEMKSQEDTNETPPPESNQTGELIEKNVNLKANIEGGVEIFQLYEKIKLDPSTIIVRGSPEALKNLTIIETEPLQLSWLKEQQHPLPVKLMLPTGVKLKDPDNETVLISIEE